MAPTATAQRPSAPMDPRISERRRQVGARRRRRWLTAALAVAVVVAFGVAGWNLLHSRVLAARVVTVAGSVHTPAAAVRFDHEGADAAEQAGCGQRVEDRKLRALAVDLGDDVQPLRPGATSPSRCC